MLDHKFMKYYRYIGFSGLISISSVFRNISVFCAILKGKTESDVFLKVDIFTKSITYLSHTLIQLYTKSPTERV